MLTCFSSQAAPPAEEYQVKKEIYNRPAAVQMCFVEVGLLVILHPGDDSYIRTPYIS